MAVAQVRPAQPGDADRLIELASACLGADYPGKEVYDPAWMNAQIDPSSGSETWIAEVDGVINASISFLRPGSGTNPILNLGRNLFRPESFQNDSATTLLQAVNQIANERGHIVVARVPAHDNAQQILFENFNYSCVGFQPFKHMLQTRVGVLFYIREANQVLMTRLPLSESLSQIAELASIALEKLKISNPLTIRDGAVGYPLQHELKVHDSTYDDYQLWKAQAQSANPPVEISTGYNLGFGLMRVEYNAPSQALLAQRDTKIVAGIAYFFDEHDRCVRFIDGFSSDDISMGAVFQQATKVSQEQFSAVYIEVDILANAPRLLKTAEQLGFVPVTYLPAFYCRNGAYADVVKMIKLNMPYALDGVDFTAQARTIAEVIDRNFQDQKVGVAIINLLRTLPIFEGLGDGELRKIARLFTQKLFRPGEQIFKKGDVGDSAYVVMRGQIDIQLEENAKPIAAVSSGKIFGELSLLDGAPRNAFAVAGQASIVLVVQRNSLSDLAQREPHLGMVIMKNIAMDLSNKLRLANTTIATLKQGR
jgi:CRP/FNR family cyclic AMP-dependent transcriptional regulator